MGSSIIFYVVWISNPHAENILSIFRKITFKCKSKRKLEMRHERSYTCNFDFQTVQLNNAIWVELISIHVKITVHANKLICYYYFSNVPSLFDCTFWFTWKTRSRFAINNDDLSSVSIQKWSKFQKKNGSCVRKKCFWKFVQKIVNWKESLSSNSNGKSNWKCEIVSDMQYFDSTEKSFASIGINDHYWFQIIVIFFKLINYQVNLLPNYR